MDMEIPDIFRYGEAFEHMASHAAVMLELDHAPGWAWPDLSLSLGFVADSARSSAKYAADHCAIQVL